MTEVSSLTGRLLVAAPALADPNFDRAVVLLLDHDEEGSSAWSSTVRPRSASGTSSALGRTDRRADVVFQGGPVSLDSALGVAVIPGDEGPLGWRRVHGAIGLVDLETPPELLGPALGSLRIFAGTRAPPRVPGEDPQRAERRSQQLRGLQVDQADRPVHPAPAERPLVAGITATPSAESSETGRPGRRRPALRSVRPRSRGCPRRRPGSDG